MRITSSLLLLALTPCLTGCISDYCDTPYTTSEVWIESSTSEPLYYTFSDNPYLTPDCTTRKLPVKLAYILDFQRFSPLQVLANPTYTANEYFLSDHEEHHYRYMLLLHYDYSLVACYDISQPRLAEAAYPWFSPEAHNTEMRLDEVYGCDKPETTFIYTYYITDSIL